ncbi:histidine--tRNA ligase [Brockia lithotrophica]|uniref:Histidine--tRNA ligase n=1 Tax=Brockia lithotrophica TaxID=933949 RepID=A0A660L4S0_9BACL|nr:histidine--tRNA ligase [Brockia lithotrophica]RKQ88937.1 histidyl-tRNA synthetase [Brockia lithotrophica]
MEIRAPRGTEDLFGEDLELVVALEERFREHVRRFGFQEIRTPILEYAELFVRSVGPTTDIVEKEMFTFPDRGGRVLALRPEGTAPVVRAYVNHKLYADLLPVRLAYAGPMFRYERPQAGRQRQFHQLGVEVLGGEGPELDAEVIALGHEFLASLGLGDVRLELSSVGCPVCRPRYLERLREYFLPHRDELCPDCQRRLERNPLRILDCKLDRDKDFVREAPKLFDSLCDDCRRYHEEVAVHLTSLGIPFVVNPHLVRGLDYYVRTAFEWVDASLGAQDAVGGGGRYDGLVAELGGPPHGGIGFALGVERLVLGLKNRGIRLAPPRHVDVYVAAFGGGAARRLPLLFHLRRAGFVALGDADTEKVRTLLRRADRLGARVVVLVGDEEVARGEVAVKDLASGTQEAVREDELVAWLRRHLAQDG